MLVIDTARPPQSHQKASAYHNVQGVLGGAVLLHFLQTTNLTLVSADTLPAACCSVQQAYVTVLLNRCQAPVHKPEPLGLACPTPARTLRRLATSQSTGNKPENRGMRYCVSRSASDIMSTHLYSGAVLGSNAAEKYTYLLSYIKGNETASLLLSSVPKGRLSPLGFHLPSLTRTASYLDYT